MLIPLAKAEAMLVCMPPAMIALQRMPLLP